MLFSNTRKGIIENLASRHAILVTIGMKTKIISWLLKRVRRQEQRVGQNKQYAAELLQILVQSSTENRKGVAKVNGVDVILQILSAYRRKDPARGFPEEEFVENLFGCLTCVVSEWEGKMKFVEAEGVELCLLMITEGMMSKPRALRLLDHALQGQQSGLVGEKLVDRAGLKSIFSMLMKKVSRELRLPQGTVDFEQQDGQTREHLLGIIAALLQWLPANSGERIRLLAKFVEKDYQKIDRLLEIRKIYAARVAVVDDEIQEERNILENTDIESSEIDWLSRRLEAGLFCLQVYGHSPHRFVNETKQEQTVDLILAWLAAEDDGMKSRIQSLMAQEDKSLEAIKSTLQGTSTRNIKSCCANRRRSQGDLIQYRKMRWTQWIHDKFYQPSFDVCDSG